MKTKQTKTFRERKPEGILCKMSLRMVTGMEKGRWGAVTHSFAQQEN